MGQSDQSPGVRWGPTKSLKPGIVWGRVCLYFMLCVSTAFFVLLSFLMDVSWVVQSNRCMLYWLAAAFSCPAWLCLAGLRSKRLAFGFAGLVLVFLISTTIAWHPKKRFIRDVFSVKSGMTVEQVDLILGKYVLRVDRAVKWYRARDRSVRPADRRRVYAYPGGDANLGYIGLKDGRVIAVEFSPD